MQKEKLLFLGGPLHEHFNIVIDREQTIYFVDDLLYTKTEAYNLLNCYCQEYVLQHCYQRKAFSILKKGEYTPNYYYCMVYCGYDADEYLFNKQVTLFDSVFKEESM
jgi:hypothetical protein